MIHLIIPDNALRGAVVEGIKVAALGEARETKDIAAALNGEGAAAIILDEAAADKKSLKAFQESGAAWARVFLLGEGDAAWTDHPAVECFPKPLRLGHLLSRLSFYLGAVARTRNETVVIGGWRFDPQNRQLVGKDGTVRLTEKETALLDYLAQSDAPVSREELLAAVWGHDDRIDTHTLETHIYQLRRKLGAEENLLVNEEGAYCLKGLGAHF